MLKAERMLERYKAIVMLDASPYDEEYQGYIKKLQEAIDELKALDNKTCEGCKFGKYGVDSLGIEVECELNWDCNRGRVDKYERKVL